VANRESPSESALVGRSKEILGIDRAIETLKAGRGQVLMLAGEPGIGKSTLASLAARRAEADSLPVFWGFAWEAGGAPGYWPWMQLLGSLVSECKPGDDLVSSLDRLLPGIHAPADARTLQPNQARFQLLESVRRLLEDLAQRTPLVLILEDLHAADSDSLHLLQYVSRHLSNMPVLLIGTFREAEARIMLAGEPLWRVCRDAQLMRLGRLDRDGVREFLQVSGGSSAPDREVERLFEITEGNPLFLTELVSLLARRDSSDARLPVTVEQVIRQQVSHLPEGAVRRLTEASVLGREFDVQALAAVSASTADELESELTPAIATGLLRETKTAVFRFSHVLHRDVLYQDINPSRRSALHLRYAQYLEQLIAAGHNERWTELARHLDSAGEGHRGAAIAAWRKAARRALERLAFADAAESLQNALQSMDQGPAADLMERYRLLLECAEAMLLAGVSEAAFCHCRQAFEIARDLGDATMMAEAALTWGGAIVVAKVDADLIAALRQSLAALPDDQIALRARVQARLAGALQPAPDPGEPMDMAREAIAMARSTGDEGVIYGVLRFAISALMDFALPAERIPLNEEFGALAERRGDVPGQFRSQLRLMIDACEAANRDKMDAAIEEIHSLAEKIGLPHYRWRAASARAMQATISGDFARAKELLDAAQRHAEEFGDVEAGVTLPLQRLAILIDWDGDCGESFERITARLREAYVRGMARAEEFVTPLVVAFGGSARNARALLDDERAIARIFAGGDRHSLSCLGEMAAAMGVGELATRTLEALRPHEESCATAGLMGSICTGPTAWSLGLIARGLGRLDDAREFLQRALDVAEAMRSPPWIARISLALAEAYVEAGLDEQAATQARRGQQLMAGLRLRRHRGAPVEDGVPTPSEPSTRGHQFSLERDGELWQVSYDGEMAMFKPSRGLEMLAVLVARPDADVHVLDLSGASPAASRDEAGALLDRKARSDYQARIEALREQLDEADQFGDSAGAEAAREEIEFIGRELTRAFGIGGRSRPSGKAAERARVNVRRRLKDAIDRIGKQNPGAGRYLENTVKTGTYCRYTPM
jgi:tetratricopeptide (TPR) repeat protein